MRSFDPEFVNVGTQTLKVWLRYWKDDSRSQAEADAHGEAREDHIRPISAELAARGDPPDDCRRRKPVAENR
jgi:hypothetical protein